MRKKNNTTYYYFFIAVLVLLITSSTSRLLCIHQFVSSPVAAASIKNGIEKVKHSPHEAVDLLNGEQATAFFQDNQGSTTFGASHKQKNLIDAGDVTSSGNDRNAVNQKIKRFTLPVADELQKILLLFPFHSFW